MKARHEYYNQEGREEEGEWYSEIQSKERRRWFRGPATFGAGPILKLANSMPEGEHTGINTSNRGIGRCSRALVLHMFQRAADPNYRPTNFPFNPLFYFLLRRDGGLD